MFCFYIIIFKEPLEDDVKQWIGPHEQVKLSAVLVFISFRGKKSFFTFNCLEWLLAPTEPTKYFTYLVVHILDMLLSGLTDGLIS